MENETPTEQEARERLFHECQTSSPDFGYWTFEREKATIRDAYFGKQLNLQIAYDSGGEASVTYTEMEYIEGLMNALGARRTEDLKGKRVLAYFKGLELVGLSKLTKDQ